MTESRDLGGRDVSTRYHVGVPDPDMTAPISKEALDTLRNQDAERDADVGQGGLRDDHLSALDSGSDRGGSGPGTAGLSSSGSSDGREPYSGRFSEPPYGGHSSDGDLGPANGHSSYGSFGTDRDHGAESLSDGPGSSVGTSSMGGPVSVGSGIGGASVGAPSVSGMGGTGYGGASYPNVTGYSPSAYSGSSGYPPLGGPGAPGAGSPTTGLGPAGSPLSRTGWRRP